MTFRPLPKYQGRKELSKKLARYFSARIRDRGNTYFAQGLVKIVRATDDQLEARVRGSQDYTVLLDWNDGALLATCECPYFDGGDFCKHLWATVLAAEEKDLFPQAAMAPDLMLEFAYYEDHDFAGDEQEYEDVFPSPPPYRPPAGIRPAEPRQPLWQTQIGSIVELQRQTQASRLNWPAGRQILYVVDADQSRSRQRLVVSPVVRDPKADGTWKTLLYNPLRREQIPQLPSEDDREIMSVLSGVTPSYNWGYVETGERVPDTCPVPQALAENIITRAARTGRCYLRISTKKDELSPVSWDDGGPWNFGLELRRQSKSGWEVAGVLRRREDRIELKNAALITPGGLMFAGDRAGPMAGDTPFESLFQFQKTGPIHAPNKDLENLLGTLLSLPGLPDLEVPDELRYEEVSLPPQACLRIRAKDEFGTPSQRLRAELAFDYDGRQVPAHDQARGFYQSKARRYVRRDPAVEEAATSLLSELGVQYKKPAYLETVPEWTIAPTKLPRVVRALVESGWHIEADGKVFRRPGAFNIEVSSGIDWFELHGKVEYGEGTAQLPALLEALRHGESMVRLDDGTFGVLPEQWLKRIGLLAGLGAPEDGHIRFRPCQAGLLDALLASQPEARCDEAFARVRQELGQFKGVEPAAQPEGFVGRLRDYQREGLGWMEFLRRFSFGGCLADDMGVGKTAQVLAMLEARRQHRAVGDPPAPSLIVVPRSLIFNWKQEASRFTPQLRVLDYTGTSRDTSSLADYDVILTTYGTLRRDVVHLKDLEFDYVVLDEAQAIKNAATDAAKAVRLLRGSHRLALSGTPVENHLGELWSLFEFLNPGMLGRASVFKMTGGGGRNPDEETRRLLAHALRPFILRRTKAQVAPELPAKTEQTVYCELESGQRKLYNELRQHYRDVLLNRVKVEGLAKSKIQVLEALLRLRQAACHPGLIDPKRSKETSAKLDVLLEQLRELLDEGHKALVFSQFTSLLAIVRDRLDRQGTVYEYLDGATRDRQVPVERFQNDGDCRLFLISLKAGGLGLNLTAAEYVFLLDPWWNPAVEMQAIDRAHRIGQTQQVFAYRLIARDTVEEKVLELQKTKRDLADAIISADNSLIRDLSREDLELLLS
jgi:hypothetical protein